MSHDPGPKPTAGVDFSPGSWDQYRRGPLVSLRVVRAVAADVEPEVAGEREQPPQYRPEPWLVACRPCEHLRIRYRR